MWKVINPSPAKVSAFNEVTHNDLLSRVLINRGFDYDLTNNLLNAQYKLLQDPMLLVNVKKGAQEIIDAIEAGAEIWTFNDYDVDGVTSGFTMTNFLQETTDNIIYPYYPERKEGYGLSIEFCKKLYQRKVDNNIDEVLVITNDNGTSCLEQVAYLKEHGIRVVVTDHHQPKDKLPDCTVINPHIVEDTTYHHLSGCGVSFKVIQAIEVLAGLKRISHNYLFAVALGTVADMMPAHPENEALISLGMFQMNNKKICPIAIEQWKKFLGIQKMNPNKVGWEIGPRINATGRMGNINLGASLLYTDNKDDLIDVLTEIEELNEERKTQTKKAKEAAQKIDFSMHQACLFDASEYAPGISGVIAGKILEMNGKPSLVFAGSKIFVGSVRSPGWLDIQPFLKAMHDEGILLTYGGHAQAAGFSLLPENVEALQYGLDELLTNYILSLPQVEASEEDNMLQVDAEIRIKDLTKANYDALNAFYYDKNLLGNPTFALSNLEVESTSRSKNNNENICFNVVDPDGKKLKVWAWGFGSAYKEMGEPNHITLIGTIDQNFMNKRFYTLSVQAVEAA